MRDLEEHVDADADRVLQLHGDVWKVAMTVAQLMGTEPSNLRWQQAGCTEIASLSRALASVGEECQAWLDAPTATALIRALLDSARSFPRDANLQSAVVEALLHIFNAADVFPEDFIPPGSAAGRTIALVIIDGILSVVASAVRAHSSCFLLCRNAYVILGAVPLLCDATHATGPLLSAAGVAEASVAAICALTTRPGSSGDGGGAATQEHVPESGDVWLETWWWRGDRCFALQRLLVVLLNDQRGADLLARFRACAREQPEVVPALIRAIRLETRRVAVMQRNGDRGSQGADEVLCDDVRALCFSLLLKVVSDTCGNTAAASRPCVLAFLRCGGPRAVLAALEEAMVAPAHVVQRQTPRELHSDDAAVLICVRFALILLNGVCIELPKSVADNDDARRLAQDPAVIEAVRRSALLIASGAWKPPGLDDFCQVSDEKNGNDSPLDILLQVRVEARDVLVRLAMTAPKGMVALSCSPAGEAAFRAACASVSSAPRPRSLRGM